MHESAPQQGADLGAIASERPSMATWAGFVIMCIGMFMAILDVQVMATSLPTIQSVLKISPDAMSWSKPLKLISTRCYGPSWSAGLR